MCTGHGFARVAFTKYCRLSNLNNRNLFSQRSGGEKSKFKVLARSVCSEASPPRAFTGPSLWVCLWSNFLFQKHRHLEPEFTLHVQRKALSANTSTF